MFEELKKCKTLNEIYQILGDAPFEKTAVFLLLWWCILPIWSAVEHIYYGLIVDSNRLQQVFATMEGYKIAMQLVGSLSVVFAVIYLLGRITLYKSQILNKIKEQPWHFFLLLMLLWACISTLLSDDIVTSFRGTAYRFDGLKSYFFYAAAYVCAIVVINSRYRKIIFNIYAIVSFIVSAMVVMQDRGLPIINQIFVQDSRSAMFFQFNHTGYFMNMGLVCVIGLFFYERRRWLQVVYALSIAFQIYALLVNSTFACYLASTCALIMAMVFYVRRYLKINIKLFIPLLISILISCASYFGWVPTSSGEDMRVNIDELVADTNSLVNDTENITHLGHGRMFLWQQGVKMIPERPIFGHGPEQLNAKYTKDMWSDRPDNEFIQHAIFLGIPGLLFYLSALISMFVRQWIHMKKLNTTALIAAACVITYLISSLFGNSMFYTTPYLYIFLGMASCLKEDENTKLKEEIN